MSEFLADGRGERPDHPNDERHCYHHQHDSRCWEEYDGDCGGDDDDDCVHCECCCTCLGCEYGPRDGMLMYPNGAPWAVEVLAPADKEG